MQPTLFSDYTLDIFEYLISKGLNLNVQNSNGITPLMLVCQLKYTYLAKEIIEKFDIDFKLSDFRGYKSIHYAIYIHDPELLQLMVKKGADINAIDGNGNTILHWAVSYKDTASVAKILELGADTSIFQKNGLLPVHVAATNDNLEILKLLFSRTDPYVHTKPDSEGEKFTLLTLAARHGNIDAINFLLESGIDINATTSDERTALSLAIGQNKIEAAKTLISKGADFNKPMNDGDTPLHMAAYRANLEAFKILIEAGAEINIKNHDNVTPLLLLIRSTNPTSAKVESIKYLLEKGADPAICDKEGKNCFAEAVAYPEILSILHPESSSEAVAPVHPVSAEGSSAEEHLAAVVGTSSDTVDTAAASSIEIINPDAIDLAGIDAAAYSHP